MANGRGGSKKSKYQSSRDVGRFIALPHSVVDSPNFQKLSANAKALLLEVARQWRPDSNGRLLLSKAYLLPRGWKSSDMISKGKKLHLAFSYVSDEEMDLDAISKKMQIALEKLGSKVNSQPTETLK